MPWKLVGTQGTEDSNDDRDRGGITKGDRDAGEFKYLKETLCRTARRYLREKDGVNPLAALEA